MTIIVVVAEVDSHASEGLAILVIADAGKKADFVEGTVSIIVVEKALDRVVCDKNIREAIPIVVGKGNTQPLAMRIGDSSPLRNVGEGTVTVVVIQDIRQAIVVIRMAVRTDPIRRSFAAIAVGLECPINVASDE